MVSAPLYAPILRTRAAELRALAELEGRQLDALLPIIELTRSRRSKTNPLGAIEVSVNAVCELLGDRAFVADLTSLESQTNAEISLLLDPASGFKNWVDFVRDVLPKNAIPVVHLEEPIDPDNLKLQLNSLLDLRSQLAIRVPTSYGDVERALEVVGRQCIARKAGFLVVADAGFVRPSAAKGAAAAIGGLVQQAMRFAPQFLVCAASSFPGSVVDKDYGGDGAGEFPLVEVELGGVASRLAGSNFLYGDYASVFPLDFKGTVTAWVPRVDVPLLHSLYYFRYRRHEGGYIAAAKRAVMDKRFGSVVPCWGRSNVEDAALGNPPGRSPAHWISVRVNLHISQQLSRLR